MLGDAEHLAAARPAGFDSGPSRFMMVVTPSVLPDRRGVTHRGMEGRCEQEDDARRVEHGRRPLR